ncbi:hypothetical protein PIB30_084679 [Stylosanthes scabra]|uniref:Uncharacterized protein n=1 Tax=Stylosanthes scabra TaxID=79078 RepID=A0ABU6YQ82_9FABA|nr:hypothetical protein [Stylosanthes scabra]
MRDILGKHIGILSHNRDLRKILRKLYRACHQKDKPFVTTHWARHLNRVQVALNSYGRDSCQTLRCNQGCLMVTIKKDSVPRQPIKTQDNVLASQGMADHVTPQFSTPCTAPTIRMPHFLT